jgi:hypothetical protein
LDGLPENAEACEQQKQRNLFHLTNI